MTKTKKVPKRYRGHAQTLLSKEQKKAKRDGKRKLAARQQGKEWAPGIGCYTSGTLPASARIHETDGC